MCGILGTIDIPLTQAALELLKHRGPDSLGLECIDIASKKVWLGHTRLSILDLSSAGHQPMSSHDGRWWLSFNGEIYNHLELRKEIDIPFKGHSDTETLIELIAARGIQYAINKLNGMYAFAALDTKDQRLYLARDPFGIKPLYYFKKNGKVIFSSEVRAIAHFFSEIGLDLNGLRQFLTLRYTPSPDTLWKNVKKLRPGHILEIDLPVLRSKSYRFITTHKKRFKDSIDVAVECYQSLLASSIKRQLLSDVPVGIFLSGGIDSALVALMAKKAGQNPPCFTVGFGKKHSECEIEQAQQTARVLRLPFNAITVTPEALRNALPSIIQAVEEPLGTTSIMPMWYLVKKAKENVTVVLTGQGSDEPWGGYFRYQVALVRKFFPDKFPWPMLASLLRFWRNRPEYLERGIRTLRQDKEADRFIEACALFSKQERGMLLDQNDGGALQSMEYWLQWLDNFSHLSEVERMMRLDSHTDLADNLLLYGDKISMAFALETRVPMLDLELIDFIESLPINFRINLLKTKVVHKLMAEKYLPKEIVHRPKKGFKVPFGEWSRGPWKEWVESLLLNSLGDLLDRKGIEQLWHEHLEAKPDRSRQIFSLLILALWYHYVFQQKSFETLRCTSK